MDGEQPTNLIALRDGKARAEALITARYAESLIDQDELERRLEALQDADTIAALERLVVDLVEPGSSASEALRPRPSTALAPRDAAHGAALLRAEDVAPERRFTALFSTLDQRGAWIPARRNELIDVCAEATLDFRDARLAPGETHIDVTCVLGSTQLLVPPGLAVRVETNAILAEVARDEAVLEHAPQPGEPVLVVSGTMILAELEIRERLPGETRREARQRKRLQRRADRRLRRQKRRRARRLARRGQRALGRGE